MQLSFSFQTFSSFCPSLCITIILSPSPSPSFSNSELELSWMTLHCCTFRHKGFYRCICSMFMFLRGTFFRYTCRNCWCCHYTSSFITFLEFKYGITLSYITNCPSSIFLDKVHCIPSIGNPSHVLSSTVHINDLFFVADRTNAGQLTDPTYWTSILPMVLELGEKLVNLNNQTLGYTNLL